MFAVRINSVTESSFGHQYEYTFLLSTPDGSFDLYDDMRTINTYIEVDEERFMRYVEKSPTTLPLYNPAFVQELIMSQGIGFVRELYQYRYVDCILQLTTPEDRLELAPLRPPFTSTKEQYLYTISLLHDLLIKAGISTLWIMMFKISVNSRQLVPYQSVIHKMITKLKTFAMDLLDTADHFDILNYSCGLHEVFIKQSPNLFDLYLLLIGQRRLDPVIYFLHKQTLKYSVVSPFGYPALVLERYPDILDNPSRFAMFLDNVMPHLFFGFLETLVREADWLRANQHDCWFREHLQCLLDRLYAIGGCAGWWMTCSEAGNGSNSLILNHPVNKEFIHNLLRLTPYPELLSTIGFVKARRWVLLVDDFNLDVVDELAELNWTFEEVRSELPKIGLKYNLQELLKTETKYAIPEDAIPSPSGFTLIPWAMSYL